LWAKPFVADFQEAPGTTFAMATTFLTLFFPVAQSPALFKAVHVDFGLGQLIVKYMPIKAFVQCFYFCRFWPKGQAPLL
jgi:hypothetical protein